MSHMGKSSRSLRLKKVTSINRSQRHLNPGNMSWFIKDSDTKHVSALLNYLTDKVKVYSSRSGSLDSATLTEFEDMVIEIIPRIKDPELIRTLKECGWTGTRFEAIQNGKWDVEYVIQMLSNYYLKSSMNHTQSAYNMNTMHSTMSQKQQQQRNAIDNIMPFCPDIVVDMIMERDCQIKKPFAQVFKGVCLLADISGFSKYSGEMCSKGVSGLDELRSVTNGLLDNFVETVYKYGGDVIAFAGDALVCVFRDEEYMRSTEHCTERALKCANLLCKDDSHHLPTHAAVSYGSLSLALLGGLHDQWVYILTGECVNELSDCINNTKKKEVAATHKCLEVLKQHVEDISKVFTITNVDGFALSIVDYSEDVVMEVDRTMFTGIGLSPSAAKSKSKSEDYGDLNVDTEFDEKRARKPVSTYLVPALLKFVPRPVKHALRSDMLDRIGELRQVTTLFLSLDSFSKHVEGKDPLLLQPFFAKAQKHLDTSGGYLRQFLVDDKGCVLIAMWGVPSFTYANNCSRALYFAVSLLHSAEDLGHKVSIGVTTGLVFCGCVGSSQRRDYVGIGTDVNIAARLMSKAKGKILVDKTTYHNANQATKVLLTAYEPLQLKGLSEPMMPYIYNSEDIPPLSEPDNLDSNYLLQKRATEMLDSHLDHISNAEIEDIMQEIDGPEKEVDLPKSIIFVLGPAGSGKSMAMKYFRQGAQKRSMKSVVIQAQSFHKGAPYSVARMLFMELINAGNAYEQQKEAVKALIQLGFPSFADVEVDLAYTTLAKLLGRSWHSPEASYMSFGVSTNHLNESVCMYNDYTQQNHLERTSQYDYNKSPSNNNLYVSTSTTTGGRVRLSSSDNNLAEGKEHNACENTESDKGGSKNLATLMGNTANSTRVANRMTGEQVLVKLLTLMLAMDHDIYAVILENGHLCDESSWKLINAVFNEKNLSCVMLVTILVKVNVSKKNNQDLYYNEKTKRTTLQEGIIRDVDELLDNISKSTTSISPSLTANNVVDDIDRNSVFTIAPLQSGLSSSSILPPATPGGGNLRNRITRKLESELPATCLALMSKKFSDVLELSGLNYDEVADILNASLQVQTVSGHLVKMVLDVSNGNPFWCKNIALFIKEHGLAQLEEACEKSAQNSQDILKTLVMCRVDHLTVDELMVLKFAAIIGVDFSYKLLLSITPHHIYKQLNKVVGKLVEQGFIRCITEIPELRFAFANPTFQSILYDLSPPRDAALVHQDIADYIEVTYSDILQPFYPTLSYHYKLSPPTLRDLAFKYTLKSADQAIAQGAFGDGLYFSNDAVSLATTEAEVRILQDVVRAGVEDLTWNQSQQTPRSTTTLIKRTSIYNSSSEVKLMRDYTGLLQQVEDMLREYDPSEEDKKKALLMKNKSTMLTWQVSYAHAPSRQNRLSMQSNQLAAISGKTKTRKKNVSWFGFNKSPSSNSADMSNRYSTRFDEEGDDDDGDEGRDSGGVMRSPSRSPLRRAMSSSSGDLQYGTGAQTDCCVIM